MAACGFSPARLKSANQWRQRHNQRRRGPSSSFWGEPFKKRTGGLQDETICFDLFGPVVGIHLQRNHSSHRIGGQVPDHRGRTEARNTALVADQKEKRPPGGMRRHGLGNCLWYWKQYKGKTNLLEGVSMPHNQTNPDEGPAQAHAGNRQGHDSTYGEYKGKKWGRSTPKKMSRAKKYATRRGYECTVQRIKGTEFKKFRQVKKWLERDRPVVILINNPSKALSSLHYPVIEKAELKTEKSGRQVAGPGRALLCEHGPRRPQVDMGPRGGQEPSQAHRLVFHVFHGHKIAGQISGRQKAGPEGASRGPVLFMENRRCPPARRVLTLQGTTHGMQPTERSTAAMIISASRRTDLPAFYHALVQGQARGGPLPGQKPLQPQAGHQA